MPIREFFHMMLMVDDFDPAQDFFDRLLSPLTYNAKHWSDFDKRWASLGLVGPDFVLELMEASKADEDASWPLPKFARRFGQHLHSLSWYVDAADMRALVDALMAMDVRIAKPGGGLYTDDVPADPQLIFTHPKDTFGQMEFMGVSDTGGGGDPRFRRGGWDDTFWRDEHPLHIERCSHLTVAVDDLARARALFEGPYAGRVFHEQTTDDRHSIFVLVGRDTVVELAQPSGSDSLLGRDAAAHGSLPHAMTFRVRDLAAAEEHAASVGARVLARGADTITLDPADCFGAIVAFTTQDLPGDPRV